MEKVLKMYEDAIKLQIDLVGREKAIEQAKEAGLGITKNGHIVSCTGNPTVVLLKLIKTFTQNGNISSITACAPLIDKAMAELSEQFEIDETIEEPTEV